MTPTAIRDSLIAHGIPAELAERLARLAAVAQAEAEARDSAEMAEAAALATADIFDN